MSTLPTVEEIAAAIWSSDYDDRNPEAFAGEDEETRNEYLRNARAVHRLFPGES